MCGSKVVIHAVVIPWAQMKRTPLKRTQMKRTLLKRTQMSSTVVYGSNTERVNSRFAIGPFKSEIRLIKAEDWPTIGPIKTLRVASLVKLRGANHR
jgi:hypothetical protein